MAGLWQQREVFDGTYTFEDLLDAHELLDMKAENDQRISAFREQQRASHGR